MVHRTPTRDKIKQLSAKAREFDDALMALSHVCGAATPDLKVLQKQLEENKNEILEEILALKPMARLEDLSVFKVKKQVRKNKFHFYWFAAWAMGNNTRKVYLGSCARVDAETALKKAHELKAKALGLMLED